MRTGPAVAVVALRPTIIWWCLALPGCWGAGGDRPLIGPQEGHDDCHVDEDCPSIACTAAPCPEAICVLGTGGFHQCTSRVHPQPVTCEISATSCCHADGDCAAQAHGTCIPSSGACRAGPAMPPTNWCAYDACQSDGDCTVEPDGFCSDGFPRVCVYGPCRTNADCTRGLGGACVMQVVGSSSCSVIAVFCQYANDPCSTNSDCSSLGSSEACLPNSDLHGMSCQYAPPIL
jgi:hypothetical protein